MVSRKENSVPHAEDITIEDFPDIDQVVTQREEKRKDWMHKTTHGLAILVIVLFLFLLTYQIMFKEDATIPDYFISIVSVIIGFYFAKAPFFNGN